MSNSVLILRPQKVDVPLPRLLLVDVEQRTWKSLANNLRDVFFPEKLPPLKLTSKPVKVRDIWGESAHKKSAVTGSLLLHMIAIIAVVALTILGRAVVKQAQKQQTVQLVAPELPEYQ